MDEQIIVSDFTLEFIGQSLVVEEIGITLQCCNIHLSFEEEKKNRACRCVNNKEQCVCKIKFLFN